MHDIYKHLQIVSVRGRYRTVVYYYILKVSVRYGIVLEFNSIPRHGIVLELPDYFGTDNVSYGVVTIFRPFQCGAPYFCDLLASQDSFDAETASYWN